MFTGLITETGTILAVEPTRGATRIRVAAPTVAAKLVVGDSIAVSGVCLTALSITPDQFEADLARETIARTSLSRLQPGTSVNLELPTPAGTPLGGHVVQGHVDGVGRLLGMNAVTADTQQTDWVMQVAIPRSMRRYIVEKGSITIEGISLTVAAVDEDAYSNSTVTIAIIPHTYAATNLHTLHDGDEVNIEVDVLAKYAEQQNRRREEKVLAITEASLIAQGF